jgi:hypothetical protein
LTIVGQIQSAAKTEIEREGREEGEGGENKSAKKDAAKN